MIQNNDRPKPKTSSTKGSTDKERKSLLLKVDADSRYRRFREQPPNMDLRIEKHDKADKLLGRRKRQSVPELVIDLNEERAGQYQLRKILGGCVTRLSSGSKKQREATSQKLMFPYSMNPLDASCKKSTSSFKNMNLKTKNCEGLREEIEMVKSENQSLREENKKLKRRLQGIEKLQALYERASKEVEEVKRAKDTVQIQRHRLEEVNTTKMQKLELLSEENEQLMNKLKVLYEELIVEKKKNREVREFVIKMDRQTYFEDQLFSRQSIFKNSFEKFEQEGKVDYYSSMREMEREKTKKDFLYNPLYN